MYNPDPNPEIAPRTLLEAYERGYQTNHGIADMRDAITEELHRNTIRHIGYPDGSRPAFEGTLVEVPWFVQVFFTHTADAGAIGSPITEEQLLADLRQIGGAGVPPGLVITLDGPVPIWRWVDACIPPRQRQAMEAALREED